MDKEVRQESSVPVATRVSVVSLAELDEYWMREGKFIRTMSQLVSWSLELLCEVLKANGKIESVETVASAHKRLKDRELYQPSLSKRSFNKIGAAIKFENLREEGIDPKVKVDGENSNITRAYNMLHNRRSVKPFGGKVFSPTVLKAIETYHRLEKGESVESIKKENEIVGSDKIIHEGMSESEVVDKIKSLDSNWEREKREMDEIFKSMSAGDEVSE